MYEENAMRLRIRKLKMDLNLNQIIAMTFLGIILLGAFALSLPIAVRPDASCDGLTALFTATSAVCVTGLSVVDVWSTFSGFGQFVILVLMETGGLGFMSVVSIIIYLTGRQGSIQSLSLMKESLGADTLRDIGRIQKRLLIGSAMFEMIGTLILITAGTAAFMALEFNNDLTLGSMGLLDKLVNSLFQAVTPRTAGFASIDQASLSGGGTALTVILMMIGGSTGSTAGGIKTVTIAIIIHSAMATLLGKKNLTIFKRKVTEEQIISAYSTASSFVLLSAAGSFAIAAASKVTFLQSFFECVSALATVGLSLGVTASLSVVSKLVLISFMYIGRVGLLTLTLGFFKVKETAALKYPPVKLLIG